MSDNSVGQVALDLVVNKNNFDQQMNGIKGMAKKAGLAIAAAFSVKKLVDFGKQCVQLGSDLAEVENVIDVTFTSMSGQVDKFSKNAATQFGLSETMAKRYVGTFGAMSKAFGFSEKQAYDMSTALTGLAGDVASFYNITQDEAYTKLKSVFTGETESLKDLGVVMTQTALDQFALQNGFGKTTKAMTEQEKVALRYAFVQKQLTTASGDFARTSDSWANQVRILKLQFDSLKASIGQGLINVLTPVMKVINTLIGKLVTLAGHFKAFTEMLTGKKSSGSKGLGDTAAAAQEVTQSTEAASNASNSLAKNSKKAGDAAKKAAKQVRSLMGFDQINKLAEKETDTSSAGTDATTPSSAVNIPAVDYGSLSKGTDEAGKFSKAFDGILKKAKELGALFAKGFKIGFGDSEKKIASIKKHVEGIGKSLKEIWTDPEVQRAANHCLDSFALNLGKFTGAVASIGLTIADNLVGGFDIYLSRSKDYIKKRLTECFDVTSAILDQWGSYSAAVADIFGVFSGPEAKSCTASIIGIFSDGFLGVIDLGLKFTNDVYTLITQPIIDNVELIKETIRNTLEPISVVLDTLHQGVKDTFEKIHQVYDEHIHPLFESLTTGVSEIVTTLLNAYNKHIAPVLRMAADFFQQTWQTQVQPAIDMIIDAIGDIADCVKELWEKVLVPVAKWVINTVMPVLAPIVLGIMNTVTSSIGTIMQVIGNLMKSLSGLITFITGVLTGDWKKAWTGMKTYFEGMWGSLAAIVRKPVNAVIGIMNGLISGAQSMANGIADALNNLSIDIPWWLEQLTGYSSVGFNVPHVRIPKIPYLAEGAYVKRNTPQLAMIGDNRHQGEFVAPEDKIKDMIAAALKAAGNSSEGNGKLTELLREIISLLKAIHPVTIDEEALRKYFIEKTNQNTKSGKPELLW